MQIAKLIIMTIMVRRITKTIYSKMMTMLTLVFTN